MPRLVVFGCSFVYGHGLPDCIIDDLQPGYVPSKMGWPNIVADKLGMECLNLAEPGIGNLTILMKVLRTMFRPDDLVITGFSYFERYKLYQFDDIRTGKGSPINYHTDQYRNILAADEQNPHSSKDYFWYNWLAIQHVELFLNSKNIKNFAYQNVQKGSQVKRPSMIDLKNYWDDMHLVLNINGHYPNMDMALDNRHPGLESNKLQAEMIYNKIREHELR